MLHEVHISKFGRDIRVGRGRHTGTYRVTGHWNEIQHVSGTDVLKGLAPLARDRVLANMERTVHDGDPRTVRDVRLRKR